MKKYIIIMGLFSLFSCNEKYFVGSDDFNKIERQVKISSSKAFEIYNNSFEKNFDVKLKPYDIDSYKQTIYIYRRFYYIGFINLAEKMGNKGEPKYFLAKINSETGEISVVR